MIRTTITFLSFAIIGSTSAQMPGRAPLSTVSDASGTHGPDQYAEIRIDPSAQAGFLKAAGDTVFYEDFQNGLAGHNGMGAWSRSGPHGAIWKYDTDGPGGAYSSLSEVITSTSVGDGFMIFDADRANSDTTTSPPTSLFPATAWEGQLVSPVLDLSATPEVHLTFQMRLRWCCSQTIGQFVDVSTDGGATWPSRLDGPMSTHVINDDPGTYAVDINLTPIIIGSPSAVRFRFNWAGSTINNSHYHWQLDDVALTISPDVGLAEADGPEEDPLIVPNPAADMAMVSLGTPAGETTEWSVVDLRGTIVLAGRTSAAGFVVPVAQLAAGTYVLQARSAGSVRMGRLLVAH